MNGPLETDATDASAMTGIVEPALDQRATPRPTGQAGDWLCACCLNRVANEKNRFSYQGKTEFTFLNPAGIRFEIVTFSQISGCRQTGAPTLEQTWFPAHAWSFCQCDQCGAHLGWYYSGPQSFAGLIKNRLVRAVCVWN